MSIKSIQKAPLKNAKVIMRVGFDVPAGKGGEVLDAFRIKRTLPTIRYILKHKASLVLIAHRGEPKGSHAKKYSMKPVRDVLSSLLKKDVDFISNVGALQAYSQTMRPGDIAILENLRFEAGEERAEKRFATQLASAANIYVNDDFSTSHRNHASLTVLPKLLPHYAGLTLIEEMEALDDIVTHPKHPFVLVIGGAKVADKLGVAKRLLHTADAIVLAGVAASTLLAKRGVNMQGSRIDHEIPRASLTGLARSKKIVLPIDGYVAKSPRAKSRHAVDIHSIPTRMSMFDIGPKTAMMYAFLLSQAHTIFWAGALGYTENPLFRTSTSVLAKAIKRRPSLVSIAGGGDTITSLHATHVANRFTHISTGGGATLAYLAGNILPGIEALKQ